MKFTALTRDKLDFQTTRVNERKLTKYHKSIVPAPKELSVKPYFFPGNRIPVNFRYESSSIAYLTPSRP